MHTTTLKSTRQSNGTFGFALTIGCLALSCFAQSPTARPYMAMPLKQMVPPDTSSTVEVATLPGAACTLGGKGSAGDQILRVFADEEGIVRFHANAPADSGTRPN